MRQFWLAKKGNKKQIALRPITRGPGKLIEFEIIARGTQIYGQEGYKPWIEEYNPSQGTIRSAVVTCPACGGVIDAKTTRHLFREGRAGERLVAVVTVRRGSIGKFYRLPSDLDIQGYQEAQKLLIEKMECLQSTLGMFPIPDEPLPPLGTLGFRVQRYGLKKWGELFNYREQLILSSLANIVHRAYKQMSKKYPDDFARAVTTYLGFIIDKLSVYQNVLTRWNVQSESFAGKPDQEPNLSMKSDFSESNPLGDVTGSLKNQLISITKVIENLSKIKRYGIIEQGSAALHVWPENYFDAVLTDPPYYDNYPYAHLSDFFYVWLKRSIGFLYPNLFTTPLTPKTKEIVAYPNREGGFSEGKRFFEEQLALSFREIQRVLKPDGIAVIVYAHKSTEGWETVINALLNSGLVINAAWPLKTERQGRMRAQESAALASSIYIVARKTKRQGIGFYHEVRRELETYLNAKLQRLWEEGIGGADFFIAAIGAAIEVFGKYEQVMDLEGNIIRADRLLDEVRTIATDFAVRQILHNGFAGEVSDRTRLYVLWRWNYREARVPFDEARKLAQSCGLDLVEEWSRRGSFVKKDKDFVRALGPLQRDIEDLARSRELIDVLHHALLLWQNNDRTALVQRLAETGYGNSEAFYRVAQAISESLPLESKEKKLLDGLLTGRDRLREQVRQTTLF